MNRLIINQDSVFHRIPIELESKQVYTLEALRYCINMISISYNDLQNILYRAEQNGKPVDNDYYSSFKEVWSIVDSTTRLEKLIKLIGVSYESSDVGSEKSTLNLSFLSEARDFRNTFQHLDERIEQVLVRTNRTVWGILHYMYIIDEKLLHSCVLFPGHTRKDYSTGIPNNLGKLIEKPIGAIVLESVKRSTTDPIITINISDLVKNVIEMSANLEFQLEEQFKTIDSKGTHGQDAYIKITMTKKEP